MLELKSRTVLVKQPAEALYDHLMDLQNLYALMPESVERFEADADTFLFGLKGLPDVRLRKEKLERPHLIEFKSASSKMDFTLRCHLAKESEKTHLHFSFEGHFNPMVRMLAEKPLQNFLGALADQAENL